MTDSGILDKADVHITADVRANSLVISAPPENIELLVGLARQLDNLPAAESQIKVFTIVNGDAQSLSNMLLTLFTGQATGTGAVPQAILQLIQNNSASSETSLVPLRFGVNTRTNSVIASGTMADLNIVEAILTKLDDGEVRHRRSVVIRLKNSPATDVATTITQFLTTERTLLQQAGPGLTTPFEQIEQEVVVVAEPVTNSLILSSTPKYFDEVRGIIEQLDARPPMVMIQVMIASVELGSTNEFGIELGLQDSVLFDRSILSNLVTTSETTAAGATTTTVISANATPGFNFNNGGGLGNPGNVPGTAIVSHPADVAGQGIANFGTGTTNSTLGYSGLVLSAASQNLSALLRALAENHRVEILQRPQIMTLDNQPAFIQVGQKVPTISLVTNNATTGNTNSITFNNVGLILGVTPRISPDGLVVMQLDAERSSLESDATGIPIFTSPSGQVVRSPIIDATTAQTTVAAMSDQTVVIGGLITKSVSKEHHGVPVIDDIPVINNFFRYDSNIEEKTEAAHHHDAAYRQESSGSRCPEAGRGRQNDLVPQRRDQHLWRSRLAAADRRVDRWRGPRGLSRQRAAARGRSAGRAGDDSHAKQRAWPALPARPALPHRPARVPPVRQRKCRSRTRQGQPSRSRQRRRLRQLRRCRTIPTLFNAGFPGGRTNTILAAIRKHGHGGPTGQLWDAALAAGQHGAACLFTRLRSPTRRTVTSSSNQPTISNNNPPMTRCRRLTIRQVRAEIVEPFVPKGRLRQRKSHNGRFKILQSILLPHSPSAERTAGSRTGLGRSPCTAGTRRRLALVALQEGRKAGQAGQNRRQLERYHPHANGPAGDPRLRRAA